jgi:transcriptional coactivator HFI1/ADA1
MMVATETFIKEVMSSIFSCTRSNGPGESGSAGFGPGGGWVQTYKYKRQLAKEEDALGRGEVTRDKSGLLPIEAKAASERGPLGVADMRIALDMSESGMANFPVIVKSLLYNYREGELEGWDDYTYLEGYEKVADDKMDYEMTHANGHVKALLPNGAGFVEPMEIDGEGDDGDGSTAGDNDLIDSVLESCLSAG